MVTFFDPLYTEIEVQVVGHGYIQGKRRKEYTNFQKWKNDASVY